MNEILDLADLCDWLGCDQPTALALWRDGALPRPFAIGGRLVRWRAGDLCDWVARRFIATEAPSAHEFTRLREMQIEEAATVALNETQPTGEFLGEAPEGWEEIAADLPWRDDTEQRKDS